MHPGVVLFLLAVLTLAGCASTHVPKGDVTMTASTFAPPTFTVAVNKTVTWANPSSIEHTVTSDALEGAFISDRVLPGATWSFTFTAPGTYSYHCALHSGRLADGNFTGQVGRIIVTAS